MKPAEPIDFIDAPKTTATQPSGPAQRCFPTRWQAIRLFTRADLGSLARSWLCRGFFIASAVITILELKGMQAKQQPASQMLEAVYVTYLVVWMHAVIFIAGAALMREADCLNDAILSRGVTRGEYIIGKLISRSLALFPSLNPILRVARPSYRHALRRLPVHDTTGGRGVGGGECP